MKRKLNLALWIVAAILAVVFLVSSSTKLFVPKEKLAGMGGAASRWVEDFSPGALKAIGALEFLAAVGLIMPAALGIAPVLVPLAATGAVLLFAGAAIMRLRRGEKATIIGDLVYLAMAAFVAWGRFGPGSFTRLTQRDVFSGARLRRIARRGLPDRGRTRSLTGLRGADRTIGSGRVEVFPRIPSKRSYLRASRKLSTRSVSSLAACLSYNGRLLSANRCWLPG